MKSLVQGGQPKGQDCFHRVKTRSVEGLRQSREAMSYCSTGLSALAWYWAVRAITQRLRQDEKWNFLSPHVTGVRTEPSYGGLAEAA